MSQNIRNQSQEGQKHHNQSVNLQKPSYLDNQQNYSDLMRNSLERQRSKPKGLVSNSNEGIINQVSQIQLKNLKGQPYQQSNAQSYNPPRPNSRIGYHKKSLSIQNNQKSNKQSAKHQINLNTLKCKLQIDDMQNAYHNRSYSQSAKNHNTSQFSNKSCNSQGTSSKSRLIINPKEQSQFQEKKQTNFYSLNPSPQNQSNEEISKSNSRKKFSSLSQAGKLRNTILNRSSQSNLNLVFKNKHQSICLQSHVNQNSSSGKRKSSQKLAQILRSTLKNEQFNQSGKEFTLGAPLNKSSTIKSLIKTLLQQSFQNHLNNINKQLEIYPLISENYNTKVYPQKVIREMRQLKPQTCQNSPNKYFDDKMIQVNLPPQKQNTKLINTTTSREGSGQAHSRKNSLNFEMQDRLNQQNENQLLHINLKNDNHNSNQSLLQNKNTLNNFSLCGGFDDQDPTPQNTFTETVNNQKKKTVSTQKKGSTGLLETKDLQTIIIQNENDSSSFIQTQQVSLDLKNSTLKNNTDLDLVRAQKTLVRQKAKQQIMQQKNKLILPLNGLNYTSQEIENLRNLKEQRLRQQTPIYASNSLQDCSHNQSLKNQDQYNQLSKKIDSKFVVPIPSMSSNYSQLISMIPTSDAGSSLMSIKYEEIEKNCRKFGIRSQSISHKEESEEQNNSQRYDQSQRDIFCGQYLPHSLREMINQNQMGQLCDKKKFAQNLNNDCSISSTNIQINLGRKEFQNIRS
eukprot:403372879